MTERKMQYSHQARQKRKSIAYRDRHRKKSDSVHGIAKTVVFLCAIVGVYCVR